MTCLIFVVLFVVIGACLLLGPIGYLALFCLVVAIWLRLALR